ncbi:MAG: alpha-L-fucosidase [Capsulimonas sp.]|uniref:alpha-L-fucosidase n=1 Tax=Capsulimonas sp. TaxID=2494211 RepID=UPI003266DA4E
MLRTPIALLAAAGLLTIALSGTVAKAQGGAASSASVDPHANETKGQRDARMKWWREARFGMFIHWGLYAVPAGVYKDKKIDGLGEWMMHDAKVPVGYYADYAKQFDPEQFDAAKWVSYAKAAGMKYIVMTAKHHEGFAMYPTKVDDFNINAQTNFKRDPIGEMAAACKKAGIKFGVYYSQNLDWHHPGGGTAGDSWDPAQAGDFDAYVRKVSAPQVEELITRYHPAVLWWDINGPFTPDQVRALTASFPKDPELIFNNRLGGGVPGDTETPEQTIPRNGFPGKDWETCMTINETWGFKTNDTNFKSVEELTRNLIDIASKGGNYLLNVGPDSHGVIPAPEVERIQAVGAWLKRNGDSIYATTPDPFKRLPFEGRATVKGNTVYLNVFTWPENGLRLAGLLTDVKGAKALATGQKLSVMKDADGTLMISKPSVIDPVSTVVALQLAGPVALVPEPPRTILVPTSEKAPQTWKYTTVQPSKNWADADFDDAAWKSAPAPFGQGVPGVNTPWTETPGDIWIRRSFTVSNNSMKSPLLTSVHDDEGEAYINGVLAAKLDSYTRTYDEYDVSAEAAAAIKTGENVLAIHCHQGTGEQSIDAGLTMVWPGTP